MQKELATRSFTANARSLMSKLKKVLVIYLVASSVIAHVLFASVIINTASARRVPDVGTITDVSVLKDGDNSYVGYAVDYKGQTLYVPGARADVKTGDHVGVTITEYPLWPRKHLLVTVRTKATTKTSPP